MEWQVNKPEQMGDVARDMLELLTPGAHANVLALHGNLGAGKTTLIQAIAEQLGVEEPVTSPTFVIMKSYTPRLRFAELVHIDAYRLDHPDELVRLGFGELLEQPNTLICIEWPERIAELLPSDTEHIHLNVVDNRRLITREAHE